MFVSRVLLFSFGPATHLFLRLPVPRALSDFELLLFPLTVSGVCIGKLVLIVFFPPTTVVFFYVLWIIFSPTNVVIFCLISYFINIFLVNIV